jgi:hypothetical protein
MEFLLFWIGGSILVGMFVINPMSARYVDQRWHALRSTPRPVLPVPSARSARKQGLIIGSIIVMAYAAAIAIALLLSADKAPAGQLEMKYPNWFAYQQAWLNTRVGGDRYLRCDYTARLCLDGSMITGGGTMVFVGVILDGNDRKTILRHIACYGDFDFCADFDRGIDPEGRVVTLPDMPIACVEEMRQNGVVSTSGPCKGYTDGFRGEARRSRQ